MKTDTKYRYPVVLTIAGSDSSGGAGIQADIKTCSALGVYGASAITSVTAQNTLGVRGIQAISPDILKGQIEAVFDDITVDAVKIGMLHNKEAVQIVADAIDRYHPPYVVLDPVMISTSGSKLMEEDAIEAVITHLFPRITLLTPNIDEAAYLSGISIVSEEDMTGVASKLMRMGCHSVLIKGGHLKGEKMSDILYQPNELPLQFTTPTIHTINTHGTGCSLSAAIAACLAKKQSIENAVETAKNYVTTAILNGAKVKTGHGHGPLNHFFAPIPLIKVEL